MKLTLYESPGAFLEQNRVFLEKYEAACQLNYGNAQGNRDEKCRPDLLFGRYEEQGEPVLLFGHTLPWNICLNAAPGDERSVRAAQELAGYLKRENLSIAGINASKALCDAFIPAYGEDFRFRTGMDIMVLEKLIQPAAVPGKFRRTTPGDLDLLTAWAIDFTREALHREPDPETQRQRAAQRIERSCLWESPDGTPVSTAHISRRLSHGACISGVYTPPQFRGKGYCQNTVAALCREILEEGNRYCTLFVDKVNPISNRVYQKIGFAILEDNYDYRLESALGSAD